MCIFFLFSLLIYVKNFTLNCFSFQFHKTSYCVLLIKFSAEIWQKNRIESSQNLNSEWIKTNLGSILSFLKFEIIVWLMWYHQTYNNFQNFLRTFETFHFDSYLFRKSFSEISSNFLIYTIFLIENAINPKPDLKPTLKPTLRKHNMAVPI